MAIIVPQRKQGPQRVQAVAPTSPVEGQTWYDESNKKLKVYNGSEWIDFKLIGGSGGSPYGYICGGFDGSNFISTIDRITFPFDSGTASHIGNLSQTKYATAACNSSKYGYVCGAEIDESAESFSTVDRITFPFDSGTASHVGNLSSKRGYISGCNSSNYGYTFGGQTYSTQYDYHSYIDRFSFPFDSGTATHVGNLNYTKIVVATNNSSNYGYCCGGSVSGAQFSIIDRIAFPFDSGTATHVGNMSSTRYANAGCNSSNYGYSLGGTDFGNYSQIDRITFPFDSGTSTHVGNLSRSRSTSAGCNSSNYGYDLGGNDYGNYSQIDRITFPFDSGTSTHVGNLSRSRYHNVGCDGTDFVTMFV